MAETLLSPGVLARETDQSFIQGQPVQAGAAVIGPAAKGPVGIPTLVTSYSEYQAIFGSDVTSGSQQYEYLTQTSANNYFSQGGNSLLVTRVASGSFTGASSTSILNGDASSAFTLETLTEGEIANSSGSEGTNNTLENGTKDNIRWEIQGSNTDTGTFSLLVRRGDDNSKQKNVLETFQGLSLDPKAPNYIAKAIGDTSHTVEQDGTDYYVKSNGTYVNKSKYIRVSAVNTPTVDYFDNNGTAKAALTGSIPADGSGSFTGATGTLFSGQEAKFNGEISVTNIQGLAQTDYTESINLLSNKDEYRYNLITAPGLNNSDHGTAVGLLVSTVESRQDAIAVIDLNGYDTNVSTIVSDASGFDSSYAATYWPWLQTLNTTDRKSVV